MSFIRLFICLALLPVLGGCAFGQRIDYRQSSPWLLSGIHQPVRLSVLDERPYVLSGSKQPTYAGTLRGLYYNPFNVTTVSGNPVSYDIREALRAALARSTLDISTAQAGDRAQKQLVVKLREWKMDGYMNVRFDYDVIAVVQDAQGRELARKRVAHSGATTHVIASGANALAELLNAPEITAALSEAPAASAN